MVRNGVGTQLDMIKTFDTKDEPLFDVLLKIKNGNIQLPDFQRDWMWDDEDIAKLLESISCSYPIGSMMLLQTGKNEKLFSPRPISGLKLNLTPPAELLILDGQQRLTALYQAIFAKDVVVNKKNSKKNVTHRYYIDIKKSLQNEDREDREGCIVSCTARSETRQSRKKHIKTNVETEAVFKTEPEQFDEYLFPVSEVINPSEWRMKFEKHKHNDEDDKRCFNTFETEVIKRFQSYHLPVITLYSAMSKGAICSIFESVNSGNTQLTAFDLLTAHFATSDVKLRKDWEEIKTTIFEDHPVLEKMKDTDFLQIMCLVITYRNGLRKFADGLKDKIILSCARNDMLNLISDDYKKNLASVKKGFEYAAKFLKTQKIIHENEIPFPSQRIPLTAIYAILREEEIEKTGTEQKISKWFWCSIFNESYSGRGTNGQYERDVLEVVEWIKDNSKIPIVVRKINFNSARLEDATKNSSALFRGVYVLFMLNGCRDFISGKEINIEKDYKDKIEIHHIFSKNFCKQHNILDSQRDSIINKTPLLASTNAVISDIIPSKYISKIKENDKGLSEKEINEIFESHLIDVKSIRGDNFRGFYNVRRKNILEQISKVTGMSNLSFTDSVPEPVENSETIPEINTVSESN